MKSSAYFIVTGFYLSMQALVYLFYDEPGIGLFSTCIAVAIAAATGCICKSIDGLKNKGQNNGTGIYEQG